MNNQGGQVPDETINLDPEGSEGDAYDPHDRYIDFSRVEELPAIMARVQDKDSAREFYDQLAGHGDG